MIPNPLIYDQNYSQISTDLQPPHKRLKGWRGWYASLLSPLQRDQDLIFNSYANGSTVADWVASTPYVYLQQVRYVDGSIYELQNVAGLTSATPPNIDTANWLKVQLTWIGARERARYRTSKIAVEYILNKYFQVPPTGLPFQGASHVNQIFLSRDTVYNDIMWMADDTQGQPNTYMVDDTKFAKSFMPDVAGIFEGFSFTINVPAAVATAITASIVDAVPGSADTYINLITTIMNRYVRAGKLFNIVTY